MFAKILIANRGEIACRIIRTARRMGIGTVAVYSDVDANALHVRMADESVAIGPAPAAQSYLDVEKIVDACRRTGAEAVHPGYGFLSEREAFAQALEAAGLVFIGPNTRAIAAMGDKIESRKRAEAAGVSIVPGHTGVVESPDHAADIAAAIGFPVMIKASAGGGGKGMRVARTPEEVAEGFARAQSEAASAFGDDRLFIEKFIENPRHIEIQVLGDRHGNVIHLGERECSIQRRNQKVIEEAPSPLLDEETRARMGAQAVALAKAVQYDSAGTVEFVAGQNREFYFLEMNTRLQVEHPVTELVAGVDLVEQMIRVAAGERLALRQQDVHMRGWAIETRIYAEDPERDFLPSTGRLTLYRPPDEGHADGVTIRNDTGVYEGGEISLYYDPLIAKLVTHAGDRAAAIDAQAGALDAFAIDGIRHNLSFLAAIMRHPRWCAGDLSTAFIAEEYPGGFSAHSFGEETAHTLAAVAAAMDHLQNERKRQISGQMKTQRQVEFQRERSVLLGGRLIDVRVDDADGDILVRFDDGSDHAHHVASGWTPGQPVWFGAVDGDAVAVQVRPMLNGFILSHAGVRVTALVYTRREAELAALMPERAAAAASKALVCPMPGLVRAILAREGQKVKAGEALCIVEAMKMENVLRAESDGCVARILVSEGDGLAVDAVIMEFE